MMAAQRGPSRTTFHASKNQIVPPMTISRPIHHDFDVNAATMHLLSLL
jgi:hypothetical protein